MASPWLSWAQYEGFRVGGSGFRDDDDDDDEGNHENENDDDHDGNVGGDSDGPMMAIMLQKSKQTNILELTVIEKMMLATTIVVAFIILVLKMMVSVKILQFVVLLVMILVMMKQHRQPEIAAEPSNSELHDYNAEIFSRT